MPVSHSNLLYFFCTLELYLIRFGVTDRLCPGGGSRDLAFLK